MKGNEYPEPDYCILDLVNSHLKVSKHETVPFHLWIDVKGPILSLHFDCHLCKIVSFFTLSLLSLHIFPGRPEPCEGNLVAAIAAAGWW